MAVIKTIKVGQRPRGIELTKDDKYCLVAVGDDDTMQMIDTKTGEVTANLPSGPDPELFTLSPDGKVLYIANENDNTVTMVDMEKRTRDRRGAGRRRAGGHGHQPRRQDPGQHLRDHQHGAFHRHGDAEDRRQRAGRFAPALRRVQERRLGAVGVLRSRRHRQHHRSGQARGDRSEINFAIPGLRSESIQPVGINITKDGKTGFVALGPANRVAVIDGTTHEVKKYLLVGQRVWHMAFTPDEKYLLTTNGISNDVSVIDVAALKVIKSIQVGELPWGVTITKH